MATVEKIRRPKIGEWKPGTDLIAWSNETGLWYGRGPSGWDYRISGQDHLLMMFDKNGHHHGQSAHKSVDEAKMRAVEFELQQLGKKAPRNFVTPLQLPAAAPSSATPDAPSFEHQMAVQMGWAKPGPAEGTPVPLEQSKIDGFPASKGTELLDLDMLFESPHNPRKLFKDIEPLARSILATGGLLQPIVARPVMEGPHQRYEIAAGARRFRAMVLLSKQMNVDWADKVLVDIRELTDAQMAEAMMAENDQRDGLLPLEQAMGYSNMLKTGFTIDTIAEKLGVSTGTVHGRLQLLKLGKEARRLVLEGKLPSSLATLIGRYPEALQEEALLELEDARTANGDETWNFNDGTYNVRASLEYLQEHFTRSLKSTPFDQKDQSYPVPAELWPERAGSHDKETPVAAPSCSECPRNSKNMAPEIAGENPDGGRHGFCTLPPCFDAKRDAEGERLQAKAKEEGLKLLPESKTWQLFRDRDSMAGNLGFVKADDVAPGDSKKRTYRQVIEEVTKKSELEPPAVQVALTQAAGRVDLFRESEALKVLAKGGVEWAKQQVAREKRAKAGRTSSAGPSAASQKTADKHLAQERVRATVFRKVIEHYLTVGLDLPALRAMIFAWPDEGPVDVHEILNLKSRKEVTEWAEKKASLPELLALVYASAMGPEYEGSFRSGYTDEVERAAKVVKVDIKKLEEHEIAAIAAQRAAEAILWTKSGKKTVGKSKAMQYVITEEKATSAEAKQKGLKTWFKLEFTPKGGGITSVGAGGRGPFDTLELAQEAAYEREKRGA